MEQSVIYASCPKSRRPMAKAEPRFPTISHSTSAANLRAFSMIIILPSITATMCGFLESRKNGFFESVEYIA